LDVLRADAEPDEGIGEVGVRGVVPERVVVDVAGEVGRDDDKSDLDDVARIGTLVTNRDVAARRGTTSGVTGAPSPTRWNSAGMSARALSVGTRVTPMLSTQLANSTAN